MALDSKQKKQMTIIVVLLLGFALYEVHEMKKKQQKALIAAEAPKALEVKKDAGNEPPAANSSSPLPTRPAAQASSPSTAPVGPAGVVDAAALKVSKNITAEEKALYFKRQEELTGKAWGHDPFYPEALPEEELPEKHPETGKPPLSTQGVEPAGTETAFKLTGISKIGQTSYATINRKMLQVGESISGYRVMHIREDGVTLQKNQRNYELRLGK